MPARKTTEFLLSDVFVWVTLRTNSPSS